MGPHLKGIFALTMALLLSIPCNAQAVYTEGLKSFLERSPKMKKTLFKGVELYSWTLAGKPVWTMLIGTNRNKTEEEVHDPEEAIKSLPELERLLAKLAPGEYVSVVEGRGPAETAPLEDAEAIKNMCKRFKLNYSGPQKTP